MRRSSRTLIARTALTAVTAVTALTVVLAPAVAHADDGATPAPSPDLVGPVELGDPGRDAALSARAGGPSLALKGRGNGHGRGLSQYGAKGAAEDGDRYRQILGFYYPGTSVGSVKRPIRVLITGDTSRDLVVADRRGLRIRKVGGSWSPLHDKRPRAVRWRVLANAQQRSVVSYKLPRGGWNRLRVIRGDAEINAGKNAVRLVLPSGSATYRGTLRSVTPDPRSSDGPRDRDTVNVLPLEQYLRGVVPLEMPALWSKHAVRAQAVAARTYAAYERAHPSRTHYHVLDNTGSQVYGGKGAEHPASNQAIKATRREVRTKAGKPAFTQFSASNGGWTVKGGFDYLRARKDDREKGSGNPYATWQRDVSYSTIEAAYPGVANLSSVRLLDRDGHGQWNGRVGKVRLRGSGGTTTPSGESFRLALGLPSTWFTKR